MGLAVPADASYELVTPEIIDRLGEPVLFLGRGAISGMGTIKPLSIEATVPSPDSGEPPRLYLRYARYTTSLGGDVVRDEGFYKEPISSLSGIETEVIDGEAAMLFRYWKQKAGEEVGRRRVVAPSGEIFYGVHLGHRGDEAEGIPPEDSTWYFSGRHIGNMMMRGGDGQVIFVREPEVTVKAFPFTRVIEGPLGNPQDEAHRAQFGIY